MRYFQEVEIAKICYVREAVAWLVLGVVPDFSPDDDGEEIRGNISAFLNEYSLSEDPLTPAELAYFNANIDYDTYLDLMYAHDYPPVETNRETVTAQVIEGWQAEWAALDAAKREKLSKALYLFEHEVDRAKSQVMSALVQGRIELSGYWFESDDALHELSYNEKPDLEVIPANLISTALFDWEQHTLKTYPSHERPAGAYYLITMETRAMLAAFSRPQGQVYSAKVFNGNAILDDPAGSPATKTIVRSRGRPPKAEWLRDGMRAWYMAQCAKGKLGIGKTEADLAQAQAWAANAGSTVSRTTVQNYLRGLLKTL